MIGAVDIGGTKIAVGMVDEVGRVLSRLECPTEAERGPDNGISRMVNMLRQALSQAMAGQTDRILQGIGIGCTGPVYPALGTVGEVEFLRGWEGADLVEPLESEFGVPVALENDADAAALGEWAWGAGRGTQKFILVTVGTGIGAGLVLDGQLYRGADGSHPEIGHHVIDPSGPPCSCGAHGCWESLASGPAMERWAQAHHPRGAWLSAYRLCTDAESGDSLAQVAVQRTAVYLGLGLANLVTLFTPDMIALSGGLLKSRHLFMPKIEETIRTNCGYVPHHLVRVLPATLDAQTGLVGAARAWYHHYAA
jgi:glucokinase